MKRIVLGLVLLASLVAPTAAAAQVPHAICTQVEPIYRRHGVSFFGGEGMCTLIAANPEAFRWPAVPLDPVKVGFPAMCRFSVSEDQTEYAVVWSVTGFEVMAAEYCYTLRASGVVVTFVNPAYS